MTTAVTVDVVLSCCACRTVLHLTRSDWGRGGLSPCWLDTALGKVIASSAKFWSCAREEEADGMRSGPRKRDQVVPGFRARASRDERGGERASRRRRQRMNCI